MDFNIAGKRVLITGASQGIGKEIALAFAGEKGKLSLIARKKDSLREIVDSIGGSSEGHDYVAVDLMESGSPTKVANYLLEKNGSYDILVHNIGGTLEIKDILSPVEDWQKVWQFNVGISIEINRVLVPSMQKNKWGRIINISSISGISLRGAAPYGAAKAYLNAYTTVLGRGLVKDGIIVSAILPGAIYVEGGHWDEKNPKNQIDLSEFFRKKEDFLRHHHAIGKLGTAKEIAPFVVFMASDKVTFASGSLINVDGGTM